MAICGFCARSCGSCANCESPLRLYQSKSDGTPWARWVVGAVPGNSVLAFRHSSTSRTHCSLQRAGLHYGTQRTSDFHVMANGKTRADIPGAGP